MMAPFPRPFALIHFFESQGWLKPLDGVYNDTTSTITALATHHACEYLQRSRWANSVHASNLDSADHMIEHGLRKVSSSREIKLLSWREQLGGNKRVFTYGEKHDQRSVEIVGYMSIIKQYLNGNLPDTEKIRRVGELEEELYYARLSDSTIPAVEISAYTNRFLISARTGENLAYHVLPHTPCSEHEGIARRILELLNSLVRFTNARPSLVESAEPERTEKIVRCVESIALWTGYAYCSANAYIDAQRLAERVAAELPRTPHYDPKSPNIVQERDGALRLVDLDNAVTMRSAAGVVRAHVAFDPLLSLAIEQRIELTESLDSAVYYTTYRAARAIERGARVPFAEWIPHARRRAQGHVENWKMLLSTPQVRARYPGMASLADRVHIPDLHVSVQLPERTDPPITRGEPTSDR